MHGAWEQGYLKYAYIDLHATKPEVHELLKVTKECKRLALCHALHMLRAHFTSQDLDGTDVTHSFTAFGGSWTLDKHTCWLRDPTRLQILIQLFLCHCINSSPFFQDDQLLRQRTEEKVYPSSTSELDLVFGVKCWQLHLQSNTVQLQFHTLEGQGLNCIDL